MKWHPDKPDMNTYNPTEKETKIPFEFGKREDWFPFEDHGMDYEQEGDVLVLDGDKPSKRVPGFDLSKMKGRFDDLVIDD